MWIGTVKALKTLIASCVCLCEHEWEANRGPHEQFKWPSCSLSTFHVLILRRLWVPTLSIFIQMFACTCPPSPSYTKPQHMSQNASLPFCFPAKEKCCYCSVWMRHKGDTHLDDSRRSRFYGAQRRWNNRRTHHTLYPQFHPNTLVWLLSRHSTVCKCNLM